MMQHSTCRMVRHHPRRRHHPPLPSTHPSGHHPGTRALPALHHPGTPREVLPDGDTPALLAPPTIHHPGIGYQTPRAGRDLAQCHSPRRPPHHDALPRTPLPPHHPPGQTPHPGHAITWPKQLPFPGTNPPQGAGQRRSGGDSASRRLGARRGGDRAAAARTGVTCISPEHAISLVKAGQGAADFLLARRSRTRIGSGLGMPTSVVPNSRGM